MDLQAVPITDAVAKLREELQQAIDQKPESGVLFEVEGIEVELQVVVDVNAKLEISGGWKVLGWHFGGKSELGTSRSGVHIVKLKLKPASVSADGKRSAVDIFKDQSGRQD